MAELVACGVEGGSWDRAEGLTFRHVTALHRYWSRHPRVDWLKAAQLGYKPPRPQTPPPRSFTDFMPERPSRERSPTDSGFSAIVDMLQRIPGGTLSV